MKYLRINRVEIHSINKENILDFESVLLTGRMY